MTTNNGDVPLVPGMTVENSDMLVPQAESQAQKAEGGEVETEATLSLEDRYKRLETELAKSESDRKAAEGRLKSGKFNDTGVSARFDDIEQRIAQTQRLMVADRQRDITNDVDTFNKEVDTINKEVADNRSQREWADFIEAKNDEIQRIARDTTGKWIMDPQ